MQHFSCLNRDNLFTPHQLQRFSNRLGDKDKDPFIGYFGREYEKQQIKVMFLGRSNAESAQSHNTFDININSSFLEFKNAKKDLESKYRNYAGRYVEAMPHWKIYQNFVRYFLDNSGLDLHIIIPPRGPLSVL